MQRDGSEEDSEFNEVDELVAMCLELDRTDRSRALDELCSGHPEHAESLRRRVAALERVGIAVFDAPQAATPERLGEIELRERLGGGGMGVVHRARQRSLGRELALELIRPKSMYFPMARALADCRLGRRHVLHANTFASPESATAAVERWEAALELQRERLELRILAGGVDGLETARAREKRARCYERLDRLDDALDERVAALQVYEDRGELAAARNAWTALARVQERLDLLDEATVSCQEALERASSADASAEAIAARAELARVLRWRGEDAAADE